MNVPEQVRRQAERANELHAEQIALTNGEPQPAEPTITADPQPAAPVEPTPAPAAPAAPAEPTTPAQAPAPTDQWEHKYRTLQGVFDTARRDWQAKDQANETRLAALEAKLAAAPAAPAPAAPVQAADAKDLETFGPELMDAIDRRAKTIAQQMVADQAAALAPQLEQTRQAAETAQQAVYQNATEKFYGELAKAVPDWQTTDKDIGWLTWLGQVDPLSGMPRQAYMDSAAQSLDHERVAGLFNAYKSTLAPAPAAAPAAPTPPALSPSPRPVGSASAPAMRATDAGQVSRSQITAHYRRGASDAAYRGSDEHKAFEARMAQALTAGQVVEA